MQPLDLNKLSLPYRIKEPQEAKKQPPHQHSPGEKFLKGPIPLKWLANAAYLPGKALHVAIVLWFLAGMKKNRTVKLSNNYLKKFGVTRYSKNRALKRLELAGLVTVKQHTGRAPMVTILEA